MSSLLRSCEEDEGTAVNSEGGDFDEEEEDDGDLDENASDINSPAAPRETAARAAPGTVLSAAHTGARVGHKNTAKLIKNPPKTATAASRHPFWML